MDLTLLVQLNSTKTDPKGKGKSGRKGRYPTSSTKIGLFWKTVVSIRLRINQRQLGESVWRIFWLQDLPCITSVRDLAQMNSSKGVGIRSLDKPSDYKLSGISDTFYAIARILRLRTEEIARVRSSNASLEKDRERRRSWEDGL